MFDNRINPPHVFHIFTAFKNAIAEHFPTASPPLPPPRPAPPLPPQMCDEPHPFDSVLIRAHAGKRTDGERRHVVVGAVFFFLSPFSCCVLALT